MSALALMLQSSPTALPDGGAIDAQPLADAAQAAQATGAAVAPSGSLDLWSLVTHASWPVIFIMALLTLASIASWVIIFRKSVLLVRAQGEAVRF
jgi:biopolymer transport protein TolQ